MEEVEGWIQFAASALALATALSFATPRGLRGLRMGCRWLLARILDSEKRTLDNLERALEEHESDRELHSLTGG